MDSGRKQIALERHHRQAAWQIWVPVGLAVAVVLTLSVLSAVATANNVPISKTLAPVAVIWVLIPYCLSGLIPLAILFGCVFLASKMLGGLPKLGARIMRALDRLQQLVQALANKVASPVIRVGGWKSSWDKFREMIRPVKSNDQGGR